MEWLQNLLDGENGSAVELVLLTLLLMVGLIFIFWVFRRITGSPSRKAGRNRVPRLSVTDSTMVDDKRYLVLVRRDNVEHLVLIGGPTDIVVETDIVRVKPVEKQAEAPSEAPTPLAVPPVKGTPSETQQLQTAENIAAEKAVPVAAAAVATAAVVSSTVSKAETTEPEIEVTETQSPDEPVEVAIAETVSEPAAEIESEPEVETEPEVKAEPEPDMEEVKTVAEEVESEPEPEPEPEQATVQSSPIDEDDDLIVVEIEEELEEVSTPEASVDEAEVVDIPDIDIGSDLEQQISEQLDSALSSETFDMEIDASNDDDVLDDSDNEMQRLLDELASESKESA